MKKKLILILALVLISVVSVICTIAFLMEEVEVKNVMTVGSVHIELLEYERVNTETSENAAVVKAFEDDKLLLPAVTKGEFDYSTPASSVNWEQLGEDEKIIKAGYTSPIWNPANITNEHDKMVFVRNTGNTKAYVRLYFAFEAGNYVRYDRFKEAVHINYNEAKDGKTPIWNWSWDQKLVEIGVGAKRERYFIATATYYKPLEPNDTTEISLSQIALHSDVTLEEARGFGDEYKVLVKAQAMQCDGFDSADAALEKGFGNAYPFKNVKEVTFVDNLKNVLTKLNGDGTDITSKVTSVTFGLTADHIDKVREYDGVLVANKSGEAVYTAYAYYVPNGENYDIYILADEWKIYTPVESKNLFLDMKALTMVDTSNLDVSETTGMSYMFTGCSNLKTLDVKDWDVSKVTTMRGMFMGAGITALDTSGWDVGEVTSTHLMFSYCQSLTSLDMSGLKFGKLESMYGMFASCQSLTSVDCSDWGVSNVTNAESMFGECKNLTEADLSGWNLSSLTNAFQMFRNCYNLKKLNTSGWSLPNVDNAAFMFSECQALEALDVADWKMTAATNTSWMFNNCKEIKELDVSKWEIKNVTNMEYMFSSCAGVTELDVSKWSTASVTGTEYMFNGCSGLTKLDLSNWDTKEVKDCERMFANCTKLTTIYAGNNWSMDQVVYIPENQEQKQEKLSSEDMFIGCGALVGGLGTKFNASNPTDKKYAHIDGGTSNPGYLTQGPAPATT